MNKHLKYLNYLLKHKYYVYKAGVKIGVNRWQLLIHDFSKFLPCEWFAYVEYFYGDRVLNFSEKFEYAWNHHQKFNKHHWQYWVLNQDDGAVIPLEIPSKYLKEMVADWIGAGHAQGYKGDVASWFYRNRDNINIDPRTIIKIEQLIVDFGLCLV